MSDTRSDDDSVPYEREDVPAYDVAALDADQPGTQDDAPLEAELGENGQGDLSPEDLGDAGSSDDGPTDLRTSL